MVDVLSQVFDTLRIKTTLFAMAGLPERWGVSFPAAPGAYFHVIEGGEGWLHLGSSGALRVGPGDVILLGKGSAHRLTGTTSSKVMTAFDPLTWSPNALVSAGGGVERSGPGATLVCGAVEIPDAPTHALLSLLPEIVHVRRDEPGAGDLELTLRLLRRETRAAGPGSSTLLARLGDVLLIQLVRAWVQRQDAGNAGWLGALRDPQIGPALTAIHADPAEPWTLDTLAAKANLSRSRFAERFTAIVGATPGVYLAQWRMTVAARLLCDGQSIREVSRAVGYASEPAFSRAFSRQHGQAPSRFGR